MMFQWIVSGVSLLVAVVSWIQSRRAARRLAELSQMQWELRYELGELRVQVQRLSGEPRGATPELPDHPAAGSPAAAFVPLATLKR
jgi:hypothetical protein